MFLTEKEEYILNSIIIDSKNNFCNSKFPLEKSQFSSTPSYQLNIDGFENVWLKDESDNPTGTHKDHMAWKIILIYRDLLLSKKRGQINVTLPSMSIISSGSGAIAIQTQLKKYGLPHLKVLVDLQMDSKIINVMKNIGCEVYKTDLNKKPLQLKEILFLTHNLDGFDITSGQGLGANCFYDCLSYEVLNISPDYCFIPFGSGNLFENIININKREISREFHDLRFNGDIDILRNCHFLGATTNNANSKAMKLYAPYLPFSHFNEQWIRLYKYSGFCGFQSNVYFIEESFLDKAIQYASLYNIHSEPSGIAGLALFFQMKEFIPKDKKILIVNTGKSKY